MTKSNLARPMKVSAVELDDPVMSTTIHLSPTVWAGVPYMAVKLFFCARDEDLKAEEIEGGPAGGGRPGCYAPLLVDNCYDVCECEIVL